MPYNPAIHHRRSIRLQGYDYALPGAYFITMVTRERVCLFGDIVGSEMHLNESGKGVSVEWQRLATRFPNLRLNAFVIMPNHIHAIVVITGPVVGATHPSLTSLVVGKHPLPEESIISMDGSPQQTRPHGPSPGSLGAIIGQFKSRLTKRLCSPLPIWQRNYYEHIIRDNAEWESICQYIQENPRRWQEDAEHV